MEELILEIVMGLLEIIAATGKRGAIFSFIVIVAVVIVGIVMALVSG